MRLSATRILRRSCFAEAFFFSVQTLGSIGFGVLHPVGLYADLLVTAESLCGLLFVAITTGLAFARFARSNARIRFSESVVVFAYNGEPTLCFRLANERGNSIREARLKVFLAPRNQAETSIGRRCRNERPGLAMVSRCSSSGPAAGIAGPSAWR
jgi:inward rectifier potassium channel